MTNTVVSVARPAFQINALEAELLARFWLGRLQTVAGRRPEAESRAQELCRLGLLTDEKCRAIWADSLVDHQTFWDELAFDPEAYSTFGASSPTGRPGGPP